MSAAAWAEEFCAKFHGGKCAFCGKRKPRRGHISCKRCGAEAIAREQARQAEEARAAAAELAYEMRAAFGPGETVVDIITGKTYRT